MLSSFKYFFIEQTTVGYYTTCIKSFITHDTSFIWNNILNAINRHICICPHFQALLLPFVSREIDPTANISRRVWSSLPQLLTGNNVGICSVSPVTEPPASPRLGAPCLLMVWQHRKREVVRFCFVIHRPSLHPLPVVVVGARSPFPPEPHHSVLGISLQLYPHLLARLDGAFDQLDGIVLVTRWAIELPALLWRMEGVLGIPKNWLGLFCYATCFSLADSPLS